MVHRGTYKVEMRRKREGKTDYRRRLTLLLGRSPRLVVRKSNRHVLLQVVRFHPGGDKTIVSAHSKELRKFGYTGHCGNATAGYLVGYLGGLRARERRLRSAVLDLGMHSPVPGSTVFAVLLGALDSGLKVPHSEEVLPSRERFKGVEEVKKRIGGEQG